MLTAFAAPQRAEKGVTFRPYFEVRKEDVAWVRRRQPGSDSPRFLLGTPRAEAGEINS